MKSKKGRVSKQVASLLVCAILGLVSLSLFTSAGAIPELNASGSDPFILGEQDAGQQINLREGQILVVGLKGNPSTGYQWQVAEVDQRIVREVGEIQFEPESALLGAPATMTRRFVAVGPGQTGLVLEYRRPWEDGEPARTFAVQVQGVGPFKEGGWGSALPAGSISAPTVENKVPADGHSALALPAAFNWCDSGGCTPIKNQGNCGSCWAFGTVGPLESLIQLNDGVTKDLAEQYLVSCNVEGYGCDGGSWAHDYHDWKIPPGETAAGAVYEADFPYTSGTTEVNGPCTGQPHTHHEQIDSWAFVGAGGGVPPVADLKQAIYDHGPVAVAVCVNSAFQGYNGGVFSGPSCTGVNHAVVLVGWDDSKGTSGAWRLRNSWGSGWGESGYMWIAYGISQVGYEANYVVYGGVSEPPNAPSNLQAAAASQTRISLSWLDHSQNEAGFKIERSPNGSGGWVQIGTVGTDVQSYTSMGLTKSTTYYYRVRAYNGFGDSGYTNVAHATTFGDFTDVTYVPLVVRRYGSGSSVGLPIDESFESGVVPPSGWTRVQTNPRQTWQIWNNGAPGEGVYSARCQYDSLLGHQSEVLLSPQFQASSAQLQFQSLGSLFWCRDVFDNCDLNIWLVVGGWGGGDDIYVGRADDDWSDSSIWSSSTINLTPYLPGGTPVRIGFEYEGQDGYLIAVDGISITD